MEYLVEASTEKLRKFEDLFNHAPCGYHTLDSNGVFIEINDTELQWLGYRREQLIGQAEFIRLLTPGSRKTFEANFAGLKSGGSFDDLDLELLRKDRTVLHATLSATAVKDERGNHVMSRWILLDNGKRKRNGLDEKNEERFRSAFEGGPLGFALVGRDHRFLNVNSALCRMVGYEPQELTKMTIEEITHPEDRQTGAVLAEQLFQGETPFYQMSKRYLKKDGEIVWVNMTRSVVRDNQGEFLFALTVVEDITERRRLDEALRTNEERFRVALKNSPIVVFNQDRELRYTWINGPVLAWAEQDYIGRTDLEIVGGPEGERLMAIKRGVLESGVATRAEAIVTFNAEKHYFDLTVEPLRDEAGTIQGVTCACTDITPMKRVAAEREALIAELGKTHQDLLTRNQDLEALNQEKTRWLGMATHDLRNPVSAILFNSEVLLEEATALSAEQVGVLSSIPASCQFMLELLDDVLDISAIESGDEGYFPESTELQSVIEESITLCRPLADRRGTHIEQLIAKTTPIVRIDRRRMRQVLVNLIGNAIKHSQHGASVQVTAVPAGDNLLVTVTDNGPGMALEELDSIFTLFQRMQSRTSRQRGTGLGLAICKRIVERHGGRIWVESTLGRGTAFHLSLAIDPSDRARETASVS